MEEASITLIVVVLFFLPLVLYSVLSVLFALGCMVHAAARALHLFSPRPLAERLHVFFIGGLEASAELESELRDGLERALSEDESLACCCVKPAPFGNVGVLRVSSPDGYYTREVVGRDEEQVVLGVLDGCSRWRGLPPMGPDLVETPECDPSLCANGWRLSSFPPPPPPPPDRPMAYA
jgi:hypothetical protein